MSYEDILKGLHECFEGLHTIPVILDYEPTSLQHLPALYSLFDSFADDEDDGGSLDKRTYRTLHRLCFRWQDNEQAEKELIPFLNTLPDSVKANPRLGGRCLWAAVPECQGVFVTIGGTVYRALDFYSQVTEVLST